jgi:choline-sulfatase
MVNPPTNLLILCADELRGDCVGFAGNRQVRTPCLDAFAQRGVTLPRHFTTFPKCVPARVSLVTGRYPHTDGYRTIQQHLQPDQPSILDTLSEAGYETAVFGKNHCWDPQVFAQRVEHRSSHEHDPTEDLPRSDKARRLGPGWDYLGDGSRHMADPRYTQESIDFLKSGRDSSRPFFLQLNLESPHPSYGVEEPYFSMFDRDGLTPWPLELPNPAPLPLRAQRECRTGLDPDPDSAREVQATYFGMIRKIDELCGRVLDALDEAGLRENTLVMFWSDHGDYAGQHTLAEKWDTDFRDALTHVPCVIAGPGLPEGSAMAGLSDHSDLAPTLLDLMGLRALPGVHGHVLSAALRGGPAVREAAFTEGGHEPAMRERIQETRAWIERGTKQGKHYPKTTTYLKYPDSMARAQAVRTGTHRLTLRETGEHELYDLQADPYEMRNRIDDLELASVRSDLTQRLAVWSLQTNPDRPHQDSVGA